MATIALTYDHSRDPMNPDDLAIKIGRALFLNSTPQVDINPTQIIVTDPSVSEANRIAIQSIINSYAVTTDWDFARDWTLIGKDADEPRINTAALAPDARLQLLMVASAKYAIRGVIFFDTTAAADFKYGFSVPAGSLLVRCERVQSIAGAAPAELAIDIALPGTVSLVGTGTTGGFIRFDMVIHNGGTPGRWQFQFAQNTATNDTGAIVRAGSYVEWARVA